MYNIDTDHTDFQSVCHFISERPQVHIAPSAMQRIEACRQYLNQKMNDSDALFYGINTGFGYLQNVAIDKSQLEALQRNLLLSHACGMGDEIPSDIVRLMLMLKIKSLCYGHSGVQPDTVQRLADMLNHDVIPVVYVQGSLGASGDLAPLSHLCLPLIGEGEVWHKGERLHAGKALSMLGWEPIRLQSKEGLALINGTQFMSAFGLYNLYRATKLYDWAQAIAAISFDAFDCVSHPLHPRIHEIRPHTGQTEAAASLRNWLSGSQIQDQPKKQVQDPYSFRCIPQVHGASIDAIRYVLSVFITEINSVTDNPNIYREEDLVVSGGNFHGQPLALGADFLAIAVSELSSISERRMYQLISGQRGLPLFLVKDPGLHSGFMIPQYTAAGIVSENKQLCTPASVDTIPSSNNQEDHVSMGANAATKCKRVVDNLEKVLAIELMIAVQALEFRRPLQSSAALEKIVASYRNEVSFNDADRYLHEDMMKTVSFLRRHQP
ncbi:MAG TPA: histidine ammonia-lyase [Chitinophagaceae bacterium]|nr:histidine ammonia-lyase [Chitinophagaceae bacterium]